MIVADNIHVTVGEKLLLSAIDLTLHPGKVHVILGPNGAGKSTLLNCLTGNLQPDKGRVTLHNKPLCDYPLETLAQHRAVLSQATLVSFPFKAHEIVMMGRNPYIAQQESAEDMTIIDEVLTHVDASSLKTRIFPTLSGGEQQRIQLARVLAQIWQQHNAALFLDEPTSALDLKHQHQVFQLLKTFARQKQWMIVVVLHDLHLAKMYGDHTILMKQGQIYDNGETHATLTPKNVMTVFEIPEALAFI